MVVADAKSFVRNILPISSLTSKILRDFLRNLLIPQDQGGGGYSQSDACTSVESNSRSLLAPGWRPRAVINPPRSRRASRSITLVIFASLRGCSTMGRSEIHTSWYRYGPPPPLQTLVRRPGTRYRGICCDAGSHTRDRGWNHPAGRKQYQCCALVFVQFGSLASEFRRCA